MVKTYHYGSHVFNYPIYTQIPDGWINLHIYVSQRKQWNPRTADFNIMEKNKIRGYGGYNCGILFNSLLQLKR
jgi:hypothetical protein